jgi:hypothetical protein
MLGKGPEDFFNDQVAKDAIKGAFYLPETEKQTIQEIITDSPEISKGSAWPVLLILLALFG